MNAAAGSTSTSGPLWHGVLITRADGAVERQVRMFGTMTAALLALAQWLDDRQVTHVALETTGVYWSTVHNLLGPAEGQLCAPAPRACAAG